MIKYLEALKGDTLRKERHVSIEDLMHITHTIGIKYEKKKYTFITELAFKKIIWQFKWLKITQLGHKYDFGQII